MASKKPILKCTPCTLIVVGFVMVALISLALSSILNRPPVVANYDECVAANGGQTTLIYPGRCVWQGKEYVQVAEDASGKCSPYENPCDPKSCKYDAVACANK